MVMAFILDPPFRIKNHHCQHERNVAFAKNERSFRCLLFSGTGVKSIDFDSNLVILALRPQYHTGINVSW